MRAIIFFLILSASLGASSSASERKRAAILLFDGVRPMDYAGASEVFGQAGFEVYTVTAGRGAVTNATGMQITPSYTFENAPKPDVIVIPSNTPADAGMMAWIRDASEDAEVIHTAGLSATIDRSLHAVSRICGKGVAQLASLNMEYNWQPDIYNRAEFADTRLPRRLFQSNAWYKGPAELQLLRYEGSRNQWSAIWLAIGETAPAELLRQLDGALETEGRWTRQSERDTAGTRWSFTDSDGKSWTGRSRTTVFEQQRDIHTLILEIWNR